MRYVRFSHGNEIAQGQLEADVIHQIEGNVFENPTPSGRTLPLRECRLLPPCVPSKVIGIGRNFKHLYDATEEWPKYPLLFVKLPTCVIGPNDDIVYPSLITGAVYETELAFVVGRTAVEVPEDEAADYIFGYTCCNDISSREYSLPGLTDAGPGDAIVKAPDNFAPLGPCIATDVDPADVTLRTWLNGELKQDASTSDLIFGPAQLLSYVSRVFTLFPGDVVTTGTPSGLEIMRPGDTVECEASGIGRLKNAVKART